MIDSTSRGDFHSSSREKEHKVMEKESKNRETGRPKTENGE
jgi:hypothetical protein